MKTVQKCAKSLSQNQRIEWLATERSDARDTKRSGFAAFSQKHASLGTSFGIGNQSLLVSGLGIAMILAAIAFAAPAVSPILFHDVTDQTGITFQHTHGGCGRRYIIETVSAGLALFDYDGDGDIDIYFLNGAPLAGTKVDVAPTDALYRNDGGFHFTDVTQEAGVGDTGYGLGVAVGDYDNDGLPDIYLNQFGPSVLYHNNGDGTFTDVAPQTGASGNDTKLGAGVCFLDADADGDLDLYVAKYMEFSYDKHTPFYRAGFHLYPGPLLYLPTSHSFYRNNGDGTFHDASIESGIGSHLGRGMGTICADYDHDGDTDIFVANDTSASFLFQNDGTGKFTEVGTLAGVAYDREGRMQGNMGVDCADYDNDGRLDFFVTTYQDQWVELYQNQGGGLFEDVAVATGAGLATRPHVKWGTGLVDFDNDGDRDLFIACGHLFDNVDLFSDTTSYAVRNVLLMNTGRGRFVNISDQSGDGMLPRFSSRGAAFDDLDNDGDIDAVILNSQSKPTLLRNDSQHEHHWLQVRLLGVRTNRDGIGAQVKVVAGDLVQIDEVHSGRSYQSHYGTRLHFGLGTHSHVDRVEVHWLGGGVQVLSHVDADKLLTISQNDTEGR